MNILFTTYNPRNYLSAEPRYYFEKTLDKYCTVYQCGDGWNDETWNKNTHTLQQYCDERNISPDWVQNRQQVRGAKKFGNLIDMHRKVSHKINRMNKSKLDLMFFTYTGCPYRYVKDGAWKLVPSDPRMLIDNLDMPVEIMPHSVELRKFYPKQNPEKHLYDVSFIGDFGLPIYPLRVNIYDNLPKLSKQHGFKILRRKRIPGKLNDLKIDQIQHDNPDLSSKYLVGDVYAEALRESRIFIFGTSILKYPVKKWFEAGASKCCIMSDTPSYAEELGLKPWVTYIPISINNWEKRLLYMLEEPEYVEQVADAWHKVILKKHTNQTRALEFLDALERHL